MTDLLTIGETMVSVRTARPMRLGGDAHLSIAGSESNVAIGVARLGHDVTWLSAVGNDEPGRLIQRTLRAENVEFKKGNVVAPPRVIRVGRFSGRS